MLKNVKGKNSKSLKAWKMFNENVKQHKNVTKEKSEKTNVLTCIV